MLVQAGRKQTDSVDRSFLPRRADRKRRRRRRRRHWTTCCAQYHADINHLLKEREQIFFRDFRSIRNGMISETTRKMTTEDRRIISICLEAFTVIMASLHHALIFPKKGRRKILLGRRILAMNIVGANVSLSLIPQFVDARDVCWTWTRPTDQRRRPPPAVTSKSEANEDLTRLTNDKSKELEQRSKSFRAENNEFDSLCDERNLSIEERKQDRDHFERNKQTETGNQPSLNTGECLRHINQDKTRGIDKDNFIVDDYLSIDDYGESEEERHSEDNPMGFESSWWISENKWERERQESQPWVFSNQRSWNLPNSQAKFVQTSDDDYLHSSGVRVRDRMGFVIWETSSVKPWQRQPSTKWQTLIPRVFHWTNHSFHSRLNLHSPISADTDEEEMCPHSLLFFRMRNRINRQRMSLSSPQERCSSSPLHIRFLSLQSSTRLTKERSRSSSDRLNRSLSCCVHHCDRNENSIWPLLESPLNDWKTLLTKTISSSAMLWTDHLCQRTNDWADFSQECRTHVDVVSIEQMNCSSGWLEQFLPKDVTIEEKINVLFFDNRQHQRRTTNWKGDLDFLFLLIVTLSRISPEEKTRMSTRVSNWSIFRTMLGVSASFLPSLHESVCICLCVCFSCRDFHADHFWSLEYITYRDQWGINHKIIENALFPAKMHHISVWRRSISQTSFELSCYSLNRREG